MNVEQENCEKSSSESASISGLAIRQLDGSTAMRLVVRARLSYPMKLGLRASRDFARSTTT
jgi:hypothetical protein